MCSFVLCSIGRDLDGQHPPVADKVRLAGHWLSDTLLSANGSLSVPDLAVFIGIIGLIFASPVSQEFALKTMLLHQKDDE